MFLTSLFLGLGIAGFVYGKVARSTGNSMQGQTFAIAGIAGGLVFVVLYCTLRFVFHFS